MNRKELIEICMDAMTTLEEFPSGGIGENGPTIEELNECIKEGGVWQDDAHYHTVQHAWRILENGIKS